MLKICYMTFTVSMVLDKRQLKRSGKYPVKLRVRFAEEIEHFTTIYDLTCQEYEKLNAPRIAGNLQVVRQDLQDLQYLAQKAAGNISPFCFDRFYDDFVAQDPRFKKSKRRRKAAIEIPSTSTFDFTPYLKRFKILHENPPSSIHASFTYQRYIRDLIEEGRIGTALNYRDAYVELVKFAGDITFPEITTKFLYRFENWMKVEKGNSPTTVGIKMRSLRAAFNRAIDEGLIKREHCYPFGKRKYTIPTSIKRKKALPISEIKIFYDSQPDCLEDIMAKDYWLFCYFGNGMNPKDMAYLKFKNLDGDFLTFIRAKTERVTRDKPKLITAYVNDDMKRIIQKWGNVPGNPNDFIFPILSHGLNPLEMHDRVKAFSRFVSSRVGEICQQLGITSVEAVNNMVGRHSFSSVLKRSGVSTEYIQDALGHYDKKTTENYLDSFENEQIKETSRKLIPE